MIKTGDLVKWKLGFVGSGSIGLVIAIGHGEQYTSTEDSPSLHPDIWVHVSGHKERWSERYVEVISESR